MEKFCTRCKKNKDVSLFHKRTYKTGTVSYQSNCAQCISEIMIDNTQNKNKNKSVVSLDGEIWINIEGFERYFVSNLGRIKSLPEPKRKYEALLNPAKQYNGYFIIPLWKNGTVTGVGLHRIIAKAFIPNPENKCCVNHINSNPSDNRIENLEWVTHKENTQHAIQKGRMSRGEKRPNSIFSEKQVLDIFNSLERNIDLAKKYKAEASTIASIKKGKTWGWLTKSNLINQ